MSCDYIDIIAFSLFSILGIIGIILYFIQSYKIKKNKDCNW